MIGDGDLIGQRYRVEARLGAGAMGVVWKAKDQRLGRTVAIKELVLGHGLADAEVERFNRRAIREGRITARLQHPHAISVYDVIKHDAQVCLILEYLPSASLADVLRTQGVLASGQVAEIGRQIASALTVAHEAGVVHRDIKPGNILIADNGTAKVTDFGISRGFDDLATTGTGLFAGTIAYLAPEVAKGGSAGFPADVFSLGATLYAAVEGSPPFGLHENALALLHRVAFDEVPPPTCPGPLRTVLMRMLDREPGQRPTMSAAAAELARLASFDEAATPSLGERASAAAMPDPAVRETRKSLPPTSSFAAAGVPETGAPDVADHAAGGPRDDRDRQRKALLAAVGGVIVLVALGALALGWIINHATAPAAPPQRSMAAPPPQTTVVQLPPPASSPPQPPTSSLPASTASAPASTPAQPAGTPQDALVAYYAIVPGNLAEGWRRETDRYKQTHGGSFASYTEFWGPIEHADARVQSADGQRVVATIRYSYKDGHVVEEQTAFGLVSVDGQWLIDSSSVNSSRTVG